MSEHLTENQIQSFRAKKLSAEELGAVADHLADCADCSGRLLDAGKAASAMQVWRETAAPAHLPNEQIEAYVARTLSGPERRNVEAHLNACPRCREDVAGLEAFRQEMELAPSAPPLPASANTAKSAPAARPFSWGRGLLLSLAGAGMAASVMWLAVVRPLQNRRVDLPIVIPRQNTNNNTETARLQEQVKQQQAISHQLAAQLASAQNMQKERDVLLQQKAASDRRLADLQRQAGPAKQQESLIALAQSGHADIPDLRDLTRGLPRGAARGGFGPVSPMATVVLPTQPVLRWNPFALPSRPDVRIRYQVTVKDAQGHIAAQTETLLASTEWRVPKDLQRGTIYTWEVQAFFGGGSKRPESDAVPTFRVASADALETLAKTRFLLAAQSAKAGLLDDAEAVLREIIAADPNSRPGQQAQNLLKNVQRQHNPTGR